MDTKILIIGLVAGLIVGAGVGYGALSPQVASLQVQVNTLQTSLASIPGLQTQITQLTSDKTTLQEQLTTKTIQVNSLNTEVASKDSQITTLQSQVSTLTKQISDLQSMLPPLPPSSGDPGSSRFFPAPMGTSITTNYVRGSSATYTAIITVLQVVRGVEAWNMIYAANPYNDPAPAGTEYILVKVRYNYINGPTLENIDRYSFDTFSSTGVKYELVSIVGPEPKFEASIYAGNTIEGWAAYRVSTTDMKPVMSFGVDYKGEGGVWFKLY